MSKKLTIVEKFADIIKTAEGVLTEEQIAFLQERADAVAAKNANRKPTKDQLANAVLKEFILDWLADVGGEHTVGEVLKAIGAKSSELVADVPNVADMTNQRVSALLTQLKNSGSVVRVEVKGRAYFKLPD